MRVIELVLDENGEASGIDAISIVENPAIEMDFVALKGEKQEVQMAAIDNDKQILLGAALVPNKMIYRKNGEEEFYIHFSKETIRKASELFLSKGNQNNSTLEHEIELNGLSVVESWIVESKEHDKSNLYNLDVPEGTWMIAMKVYNSDVWNDFVKTGKVKGFSIEGYFTNKAELSKEKESLEELTARIEEEEAQEMLSKLKDIVKRDKQAKDVELESYSDYPEAVRNNAKRGIELNKKVNNKCATQVGKVRAQQLADGKPISIDTIKRMYSYLSRAEEYYDEGDTEACGTISYLLWGGKSALRWSESKLNQK